MPPEDEKGRLQPLPDHVRAEIDRDVDIFGSGFAVFQDGKWQRVSPMDIMMMVRPADEDDAQQA
jgi:hypothetical protein